MLDDSNNYANLRKKIKARYGQALDADVYDPYGVLLLRAGKIVQEEHWVPRLEGPDTEVALGQPPTPQDGTAQALSASRRADVLCMWHAQADSLRREIKNAGFAKEEATRAVASVFDRILRGEQLDVSILKSVVSTMVSSLVNDPRALLSLALIKDADNYTHIHSVNVAVLAICLAMQVCQTSDVEDVGVGGLVHDVGKIQMPSEILHKPGPLNNAEACVMRQHPTIGARLLANAINLSRASLQCVSDHHESVNGRGYPIGKKANEICLHAQIVSLADVYDALTTDRPYRPALLPAQALSLMTQKLADLFAPDLLRRFVGLVGYHPVGSTMMLVNGWKAVVLQNDSNDPTRPALVQILAAPDGSRVEEVQFVDLRVNTHLITDPSANKAVIDRAVPAVMREISGFDSFA